MKTPHATRLGLGATLVALAAGTAWAASLAQSLTLLGETSQGRAGYTVTVTDLDPGIVSFDDLLVGAPAFEAGDAAGVNADGLTPSGPPGQVLVYLGSGTGLADHPSVVLHGEHPNDRFGAAIKVGDVVGDNRPDVVVSAILASGHDAPHTGCIYIFDGNAVLAAAGQPAGMNELEAHDAAGEVCGSQYREHFGRAIAIGNFDGDPGMDIAVGAPWYSAPHSHAAPGHPEEGELAGAVYLIRHAEIDEFLSGMTTEIHPTLTPGDGWTAAYGDNLLAMGDVDTTSAADELLIFAPGAENHGHSGSGRAYLATWDPDIHQGETEPVGFKDPLVVVRGTGSLGANEPAFVGDLTGDGLKEIGVSSSTGAIDAASSGGIYLMNGDFMNAPYKPYAMMANPNGNGSMIEDPASINELAAVSVAAITGEGSRDQFGTSMAGLGDISGDGKDDFAVGAPWADSKITTPIIANTLISGAVYVFSGGGLDLASPDKFKYKVGGTVAPPILATLPANGNDRFGESLTAGLLIPSPSTTAGADLMELVVGAPDRDAGTTSTPNDIPGTNSNDNRGAAIIQPFGQ